MRWAATLALAALAASAAPGQVASAAEDRALGQVAHIAFAGDTGTGDEQQHEIAQLIADGDAVVDYDWLVLLGDMVYEHGNPRLVEDRVLVPYEDTLDGRTTLLPVLGNHDIRRRAGDEIMWRLGAPGRWYEVETDLVHLIVLDANQPGDPDQLAFLQEALETSSSEWVIVNLHNPPYSAGDHGSDEAMQAAFVPMFRRYEVDLVMAGHEHDYQRSHPIDGITYVVSGGGGAELRETGAADFTAFSDSVHHFVSVTIEPERLIGEARGVAGVVDRFELRR